MHPLIEQMVDFEDQRRPLRLRQPLQDFIIVVNLDIAEHGLFHCIFLLEHLNIRNVGNIKNHQAMQIIRCRNWAVNHTIMVLITDKYVFSLCAPDRRNNDPWPKIFNRNTDFRFKLQPLFKLSVMPLQPPIMVNDDNCSRQSFNRIIYDPADIVDDVFAVIFQRALPVTAPLTRIPEQADPDHQANGGHIYIVMHDHQQQSASNRHIDANINPGG